MIRWPLHKAYFWETAPFFRILLPFAAGILCYDRQWLPEGIFKYSSVLLVISFTLFVITAYLRKSNPSYTAVLFVSVVCFLFLSGESVSYFTDVRNDRYWFGKAINSNACYLVKVSEAPMEKEKTWKVPVTIISSVNDGHTQPATGRALLYLIKNGSPIIFHKGDSIIIPSKWQPIKNAGNPFEYDYAANCRRNNIFYQQFLLPNEVRLFSTDNPSHDAVTDRMHDWCMRQFDTYLPEPKTKGLIQAMLLGDEVNLDEDLRQSYADTGIVHIIAISGGNVSIFFLFISALLWWLKDKKYLWLKYLIALPLVWFYVMMAGASPSAIRAAMMFSLVAIGIALQKNNNSLNQLFATAFLLLCAEPSWLFSVGFQLSFVAVLSLILFYTPLYKLYVPANKVLRGLWSAVVASMAAEILVAPLVIYYFHNFPLLFIVANVLAYLFMGIVLLSGIAIVVFSFIPAVATALGICTIWFVSFFDQLINWLQQLNPTAMHFLVLTNMELLLVYTTIGCFMLFLIRKNKSAVFISLSSCCILLLLLCADGITAGQQLRFVAYNVGRYAHEELIRGTDHYTIYSDTARGKKITYATQPAHTYWYAWRESPCDDGEILSVNGKSVLVVNYPLLWNKPFHVDYVMLNNVNNVTMQQIKVLFTPSAVVIGKNLPARQKWQLSQAAENAGIALYDVSEKGAFILE